MLEISFPVSGKTPELIVFLPGQTKPNHMQKSFSGLMLGATNGDPIDMKETLKAFPVKLTSVRDFARSMEPIA